MFVDNQPMPFNYPLIVAPVGTFASSLPGERCSSPLLFYTMFTAVALDKSLMLLGICLRSLVVSVHCFLVPLGNRSSEI